MFGMMPAYGFFIRHAKGIDLSNIEVGFMQEDRRPAFVLDQVKDISFERVNAQKASGVATFVMKSVENVDIHRSAGVPDTQVDRADRKEL
jgi:hypothetical protein